MKSKMPGRRRLERLFYCLIPLLLVLGTLPLDAGSTTAVRDVVYRGELKAHMRWIIGDGNCGHLHELEQRVEHHEALLQRVIGIGGAGAVLLTLLQIGIVFFRMHYAH